MKKVWWGAVILTIVLIRVINIEQTARFIWDESSDLVRIADLWQRPRLTMLGPISEDGVKIFGSLSYYLMLPWAVAGKFDPIAPVGSTIFFGLLTVLFFVLALKNKKLNWKLGLVVMGISLPLVGASRWAWNPHFVPFWMALGLWLLTLDKKYTKFLAGIAFGLTIHHHYYAVLAVIGFCFWQRKIIWGVAASLVPFAVWDLTHPPGLFLTRMLYFSPVLKGDGNGLLNIPELWVKYLSFGVNNIILVLIIWILILILMWKSYKRRNWIIAPLIMQLSGLGLMKGDIYDYYLIAALIPFYWWLFEEIKQREARWLLGLLILISVIRMPVLLRENLWSGNVADVRQIVTAIKGDFGGREFNLAVLGSPDLNTKGRRYRDLLAISGVMVALPTVYDQKLIYFISTKEWNDLITDPSYEINNCRNREEVKILTSESYKWKLYRCDRN